MIRSVAQSPDNPEAEAFPSFEPAPRVARAGHGRVAPYLEGLNPEQRAAVEALDGPVLVLAGAGVGKTRVLTTRIAHLIASGRARPHEILAVTFTNKAAREMRERVSLFTGSHQGMPWLGTFHSIGVKILRMHAELVGLRPNFTILDTDDQLRLIKQILQAENLDDKRWPPRALASLIDGWKNRGLDPAHVSAGESSAFAGGRGAALYAAYQARLKTLNAVDFGDLLLEALRLFRENADVLAAFQSRFRYILVDEYQDTNAVQYLWLRLLAQGRGNVCCVGDDDQSIYGWRGADVDNILRFEKDFPGARVIRLERNYRSGGHILAVAAGLIAHNQGRLGKTLFTDAPLGDRPTVIGVWDSQEEARVVGDAIEDAQRHGVSLDDVAILVRASSQMREFEERFIAMGLPYKVIGGPRFYERAEIRDALAYLRCVAQPDDDLAFERIYNQPKRGLGDATLAILHEFGRRAGVSLMRAAQMLIETEELKARPRQLLRDLLLSFDRWRKAAEEIPHEEAAQLVLEESGYIDMWKAERTPDAAGRLDNLKELVRSMGGFPDLGAFLEHVSLVMDVESADAGQRVSIMTLHAAKGLEFDLVFLPGWEEGLFPNQRALDDNGRAGLEEERRLAYVGLTRARRTAKIYHAANRRMRGLWQSSAPSRFIDELPPDHIAVEETEGAAAFGGYGVSRFDAAGFGGRYETPGSRRAEVFRQRGDGSGFGRAAAGRSFDGKAVVRAAPASGFEEGARVFHVKFGPGSVVSADGPKLTIDFDKAGRKLVMESFVTAEP
ncbi:DNA helicase-2/ATP-dependent DNA helicase PcrA [Roseiarcus fermentans]|uniref:DNA 3'-5' helicase n=1 Tax=Roseiarcus fermentans TaxID=1473586 RepID=A0A366FPC7_9HYPH|nr:DNA helicase-2/ATP-dependent DNA helicase PcrA [Roseiarcus fermentans]